MELQQRGYWLQYVCFRQLRVLTSNWLCSSTSFAKTWLFNDDRWFLNVTKQHLYNLKFTWESWADDFQVNPCATIQFPTLPKYFLAFLSLSILLKILSHYCNIYKKGVRNMKLGGGGVYWSIGLCNNILSKTKLCQKI